MRVCDLIAKLEKAPAGARVIVDTKKPIDELLEDNLSDNEDIADISFIVKGAGTRKDEGSEIGEFVLVF